MHRIGGIEKQDGTGNVNYDPKNHEKMVHLRAEKVAGIAKDIADVTVDDPDGAELLVLGWGSTWGVAQQAVRQGRAHGHKVAHAHLMHLNPFPANLGELLARYPKVLVPEMNLGQLSRLVAPSTSSTPRASPRSRACRSAPPRSKRPSRR